MRISWPLLSLTIRISSDVPSSAFLPCRCRPQAGTTAALLDSRSAVVTERVPSSSQRTLRRISTAHSGQKSLHWQSYKHIHDGKEQKMGTDEIGSGTESHGRRGWEGRRGLQLAKTLTINKARRLKETTFGIYRAQVTFIAITYFKSYKRARNSCDAMQLIVVRRT